MNSKRTIRLFNIINRSLFYTTSKLSYERTVEAMMLLAESVKNDEESDWSLGEGGECMLDCLIVGSFWFLCHYHGGMFSPEYRALSRISEIFSPGMTSEPEPETSEEDVYSAWESKFEGRV